MVSTARNAVSSNSTRSATRSPHLKVLYWMGRDPRSAYQSVAWLQPQYALSKNPLVLRPRQPMLRRLLQTSLPSSGGSLKEVVEGTGDSRIQRVIRWVAAQDETRGAQ